MGVDAGLGVVLQKEHEYILQAENIRGTLTDIEEAVVTSAKNKNVVRFSHVQSPCLKNVVCKDRVVVRRDG